MASTTAPPSSAFSPSEASPIATDLLTRVVCLRNRDERARSARALAAVLGAEDLILFIPDRELEVLLPAPGFPQTLPPGEAWPRFLAQCTAHGRHTGALPYPDTAVTSATGCAAEDGSVLVLLGGSPHQKEVATVCTLLPLLAAAFQGEQAAQAAAGHAAVAREIGAQSRALAETLDAARRELQQALHRAQEADRQKDQFLSMLAHELRNPLAPIRNAAQILKQLGPADPRLVRAREIIERQVNHQTRMLDDLLDVSRIVRNKIRLRPTRLDLTQLVRDAAEDYRSVLEGAGLILVLALAEPPMWVEGDPTRLAQVIENLLGNAAKFTERSGRVTVSVTADDGQAAASSELREVAPLLASPERPATLCPRPTAVVVVSDTGIGIEPAMLTRVFDPFAQADASLDRSQGGLGLGLALVKGLIELHGGEVRVDSEGVGRGAAFSLRLPLAEPPAAPDPLRLPTAVAGPIRVLVVEDNRDAAESLRDLLELSGCTVAVAYAGPEAVAAARQFQPEVVLCDLGLPGMNGYQVAAELRRNPTTARTRLIALSGYGQEEDQLRSREAGFDLHLTKPVDFDELQRLLEVTPGGRPD